MSAQVVDRSLPAAYEVIVGEDFGGQGEAGYEFAPTSTRGKCAVVIDVATETGRRWDGIVWSEAESISSAYTGAHASPDPRRLCVVACGTAYLIDVEDPASYEIISTKGPVTSVRAVPEEELLLLASPWVVTALGASGVPWQTKRLAIEGIRLDEVTDGWLAGVSDPGDEEPRDFAIDLRTGEHKGGSPFAG